MGDAVELERLPLDRRFTRQPEPGLPADQLVRVPERRSGVVGGEEAAEVVHAEEHGEQGDLPDDPPPSPARLWFHGLLRHPLDRHLRHADPPAQTERTFS
ncbi:hypothetical protein GCM10009804_40380 [Kribbella hippodromi]|uniref:Uncharacterized protein n=1 Tax=Kribbella hippodromi TaxID=434347 RepID=A0ABP4PFD9_9ACTN